MQFWLGAVTLALAMGLLVGSAMMPQTALAQGEGRAGRYTLVRGVQGTTQRSETVYVTDDLNEMLFIFEYSSRSKSIDIREFVDLQVAGAAALKKRAAREKR
jgi:hypothetical protein